MSDLIEAWADAISETWRALVTRPLAALSKRTLWTASVTSLRALLDVTPTQPLDARVRVLSWRNSTRTLMWVRWVPRRPSPAVLAPRVRFNDGEYVLAWKTTLACSRCKGTRTVRTAFPSIPEAPCPKCAGLGTVEEDGPATRAAWYLGRALLNAALEDDDRAWDHVTNLVAQARDERDSLYHIQTTPGDVLDMAPSSATP